MVSFHELLSQLAAEYDRVSEMNRSSVAQVGPAGQAPASAHPISRRHGDTDGARGMDAWGSYASERSSNLGLPRTSVPWQSEASPDAEYLAPDEHLSDPLFNPLQSRRCSDRRVSVQNTFEPKKEAHARSERKVLEPSTTWEELHHVASQKVAKRISKKDRVQISSTLELNNIKAMSPSRFLVDPEHSVFLERWDRITMWALAYIAVVCPIQISMFEAKLNSLFVVNCLIDSVFLFDTGLQFFVMYPKQTKYNGRVFEQRQSRIAARYLKTWFVIDVLSVIPFELVSILSKSEKFSQMKVVKIIRLLRLSKLMRVMRASRLWRRFQLTMKITYRQFALIRFFIVLLVVTHWMANLWALTLVLVDEGEGVPRWVDLLSSKETQVDDKTKDNPFKLYLAAVYFTCYTLTSVGYGDITPQNVVERGVCVIMLIISGTCWTIILEQVCGIVANMDVDEQAFRKSMDEVSSMMEERSFPHLLRRRLREYFVANKTAQRHSRLQQNLLSVSLGLRGEVAMQLNRSWISKVGLLRRMQLEKETSMYGRFFHSFLSDVCLALEWHVFAQAEMFGKPQVLYNLSRGLVSRPPRLHLSGSVWGADFMLADRHLLDSWESMALTYVELTTLTQDAFFQVVMKYRLQCKAVVQKVRYLCCWLAFQRATWKEAKKRKLAAMSGDQVGELQVCSSRVSSPRAGAPVARQRLGEVCSSRVSSPRAGAPVARQRLGEVMSGEAMQQLGACTAAAACADGKASNTSERVRMALMQAHQDGSLPHNFSRAEQAQAPSLRKSLSLGEAALQARGPPRGCEPQPLDLGAAPDALLGTGDDGSAGMVVELLSTHGIVMSPEAAHAEAAPRCRSSRGSGADRRAAL